jgi:CRP-like cAMP-binding protein
MSPLAFSRGTVLYRHGTDATGLYLVDKGAIRVMLPTADNQSQLLEVAGPGTLLGLSESMSGNQYKVTAEADEPTTALFMTHDDFVRFLDEHHEFCMHIVRLLSEDLHALYNKFRSVSAHPGRPRRRGLNEEMN